MGREIINNGEPVSYYLHPETFMLLTKFNQNEYSFWAINKSVKLIKRLLKSGKHKKYYGI